MSYFSEVSPNYAKDSIAQRIAADKLFKLVRIEPFEDVLDIGCEPGNLTGRIAEQTRGRVVGIDVSQGMINQAVQNYSHLGIEFNLCSFEQMEYTSCFDVIFCNSAFHWVKDPRPTLEACLRALKPGGRIGIQALAPQMYSPVFIGAVEEVGADPMLKDLFSTYRSPFFILETEQEYAELFESAGFEVLHSRIYELVSNHTYDEVFHNFNSGVAAAYFTPECYDLPIS